MRLAALAVAALGLVMTAGAAEAKTFTDPQGRVIVDAPNNWSMQDASPADHSYTRLNIGLGNYECDVMVFPSANIANIPSRQVFRTAQNDAQFNAAFWTTAANGAADLFPNNSAAVTSATSEHDHQPWPIERAEIGSPNKSDITPKTIHAALQLRPGLELYTYCMTFAGPEPTAAFEALIQSVRHANDATWTAEIAAQQAEHDAAAQQAAAAAAAHPQQQQQQQQGQRHNPHPSTSNSPTNNNIPPGGM
jgi:hypothetical protein